MATKAVPHITDLEASISEDGLIQQLVAHEGKAGEVIAFGIAYSGTVERVDVAQGFVVIFDGENRATLELERIESFRTLQG
jgi:hypothetical protein